MSKTKTATFIILTAALLTGVLIFNGQILSSLTKDSKASVLDSATSGNQATSTTPAPTDAQAAPASNTTTDVTTNSPADTTPAPTSNTPATTSVPTASAPYSVTEADLQAAGFTGSFEKLQSSSPAQYFSVDDDATKTSKLLMISQQTTPTVLPESALFTYGSDSKSFNIPGSKAKEATTNDGRVAINFIKGYQYVVIMGPNKTKVESLALALSQKI